MFLLKLLAWIVLIASLAWLVYDPDFEPAIACLVALGSLIALFIKERKNANASASQNQKVSGGSTGIQAGGNVHISSKRSSADD